MNPILVRLCVLVMTCSAHAQIDSDNRILERTAELSGISATLQINPINPEVGMPVILTLSISGDAVPTTQLPVFTDEFGSFDVRSVTPLQLQSSGGNVKGIEVVLVSYESGEVTLPPITITSNGRELIFDDVSLNITSLVGMEAGPNEYRDIQKAVAVPITTQSAFVWLFVVGGVAIVVALGIWWLLARTKAEKPAEPAHTWALKRLDQLEAQSLPRQGELKAFFFELTDIARTYIERRFNIDAPDRTTQEFIAESRRNPELDPAHAKLLGQFLKSADMVKFAGDRPADSECDRSMSFIRTFVTECGPRPEVLFTEESSSPTASEPVTQSTPERLRELGIENDDLTRSSAVERVSQ